jgi:hypothetical protein
MAEAAGDEQISALQSILPTPGYPLPEYSDAPPSDSYPAPVDQPSVTPFASGYEPPDSGQLPQLATMTPGPYPAPGTYGYDNSPRPLLCLGFLLSLLVLIAALIVMTGYGRRDRTPISGSSPGQSPWPYLYDQSADESESEPGAADNAE